MCHGPILHIANRAALRPRFTFLGLSLFVAFLAYEHDQALHRSAISTGFSTYIRISCDEMKPIVNHRSNFRKLLATKPISPWTCLMHIECSIKSIRSLVQAIFRHVSIHRRFLEKLEEHNYHFGKVEFEIILKVELQLM